MDTPLLLPAGQPQSPLGDESAASVEPDPAPTGPRRAPRLWQILSLATLVAVVAGGVAGGVAGSLVGDDAPRAAVTASPAKTAVIATPAQTTVAVAATGDVDLPALIANIKRSVVVIDTTTRSAIGPRGQMVTGESSGTGFVLSADGLIATNAHVIDSAVTITVTLPDGSSVAAKLVAEDTAADLAVIQIDRKGLTPVVMGSSAGLKAGDLVVAVGNALALEGGPSATLGIVSATGRTITTSDGATYTGLIQVDAAINSGDSGGPLVNSAGRVVGINTAAVRASTAENMGFAIPIDVAGPILLELAGIKQ